MEYPQASRSLILSLMDRRQAARWALFAMLSVLVHLSGGVLWVLAEPSDLNLPRIYLHEVVGVPMERTTAARTPQPIERQGRNKNAPENETNDRAPNKTSPSRPVEPQRQTGVEAVPAQPLTKAKQTPAKHTGLEKVAKASPQELTPEPETPAPPLPVHEKGARPAPSDEASPPQPAEPEPLDDPNEEEAPLTPEEILALPAEMTEEEQQRLERVLVEGSKVVIFMRTQRITESPNANAVRRAMRAVPGYDYYLGTSAFDPLTDFEWMMARNPNLSSTTTTVLMAQLAVDVHRARSAVARIPEKGTSLSWNEHGESAVATTLGATGGSAIRRVGWAVIDSSEPLYLAGPRRWVEQTAPGATELVDESPITELMQVRIGGEPADLIVATGRMGVLLGLQSATAPSVEGLLLAVRFGDDDTIAVRLWFRTEDEARRFVQQARRELERINANAMARLFDLTTIAGLLEIHQEGPEVTALAQLEPAQTQRLLDLVAVMLQRNQANGSRGASHSN